MWGISLPIACLAALALALDIPSRFERKGLTHVLHLLVAMPFFIMAFLFLADLHTYRLVWEHGGAELPLRFRLAALWEGREGPLLMWVACLALVGWLVRGRLKGESVATRRIRLGWFHGFIVFLLFLTWAM